MGIVLGDRLVALYARESTEIPRSADADDRVQENVRLRPLGGAQRDLPRQSMHGPGGVEGRHPPPTELVKQVTQILRCMAQILVVIMRRQLDTFERAADVDRLHLLL